MLAAASSSGLNSKVGRELVSRFSKVLFGFANMLQNRRCVAVKIIASVRVHRHVFDNEIHTRANQRFTLCPGEKFTVLLACSRMLKISAALLLVKLFSIIGGQKTRMVSTIHTEYSEKKSSKLSEQSSVYPCL